MEMLPYLCRRWAPSRFGSTNRKNPRTPLHPVYVARLTKEHALLQDVISRDEIAFFERELANVVGAPTRKESNG